MASDQLEQAIDKILDKTGSDLLSGLQASHSELARKLDDTLPKLEAEYDRIVSEGTKEADKIKKQIIGSSDLDARNKQLVAIEGMVNDVFAKATERIASAARDDNYAHLIKTLLDESTANLGTTEVVIFTNDQDREVVRSAASQLAGATVSDEAVDCLGGVVVRSQDGTMKFDNTIDARIERLKPLIRKEIATIFGVR